jgi:hypothetical protein
MWTGVRFGLPRGVPILLALLLVASGFGEFRPTAAQEASAGATRSESPTPRLVGGFVGVTRARLQWDYVARSQGRRDLQLGAFVRVRTPLPGLSIQAGAGYTRRSSDNRERAPDSNPGGMRGGPDRLLIRGHYLSFPLQGRMGWTVGPLTLHILAGPTLDATVHTSCEEPICPLLAEENPTVLGFLLGSGLSFRTPRGLEVGVDCRLNQGISEAYGGDTGGVTWRSLELLLNLGSWGPPHLAPNPPRP